VNLYGSVVVISFEIIPMNVRRGFVSPKAAKLGAHWTRLTDYFHYDSNAVWPDAQSPEQHSTLGVFLVPWRYSFWIQSAYCV